MKTYTKMGSVIALTLCAFCLGSTEAADNRERSREGTTLTEVGKINKASEVIGMNIKNAAGENCGEVKDLVVDLPSGRLVYAVVSAGGIGINDKLMAVPTSAFTYSSGDRKLTLNVDKEKIKSAPTFERDNWPNMADSIWSHQIYSYYGQEVYWDTNTAARYGRIWDHSTNRVSDGSSDLDRSGRNGGRQWAKMHKASEISGMNIKNPQNENLGEVEDLVIDLHSGRVIYAVVSSGGFLGVGEKLLAVPPSAFSPAPDHKHLVLNADKEKLKAAPGFDKKNWPNMANATWGKEIYAYYGQEPYWESKTYQRGRNEADKNYERTAKDADNTARNVRDREGNTLTPGDQGQTESDRTLTQRIRKAIVSENDSFSTTAKNIKIITINGHVTLRGPVNTETERTEIANIAQRIAGANAVDNQLEVKSNK